MDLDAGALILDVRAELAQFHALGHGDPGRAGGCRWGRSLLAGRSKLGQQPHDVELALAVASELQLAGLRIQAADAGASRGQVERAVGEAQLRKLERRLRATRERQIGKRKRGVGELQLKLGAGLLGGQLQLQPYLVRRPA